VAGVAHEVNNPLSSISAFAQLLLRDGSLTPAQRESLEVIKSETQRASQVVKDLLAFARRSEALREPLDLNGLLETHATPARVSADVEQDRARDGLLAGIAGGDRRRATAPASVLEPRHERRSRPMTTLGGGTLFVTTRYDGRASSSEMRDTGPGFPTRRGSTSSKPFFTTKGEARGRDSV